MQQVQLDAELVLELWVDCEDGLKIENSQQGYFQAIPITGGFFEGYVKGTIIGGGYDFNTVSSSYFNRAFAKYLLKTEEGDYISVENEGFMDAQNWGGVIKTCPKFVCDSEKYRYLQTGVFVGSLAQREDGKPGVHINIYKLK